MQRMQTPTVIPLDRSRRIERARAARRTFDDRDRRVRRRPAGRVWLNGEELGGFRLALEYLHESYD
jgi:hypothetical protein